MKSKDTNWIFILDFPVKTVSWQRKYFPTSQIIFDNLNIFLAKTFLQCLTTRHSDVCWKVGPIFFIDSWNWFQNTVSHFWISLSNRPLKWNKDEIYFSIRSIYLSVWPSRKRKKQFQYKIFISNPRNVYSHISLHSLVFLFLVHYVIVY